MGEQHRPLPDVSVMRPRQVYSHGLLLGTVAEDELIDVIATINTPPQPAVETW